jgi:chromosome segregation ATPase
MSDTPRTKAASRMAFTSEHMVPIEFAQKLERDLAQSKEANAGLMRACDNLERELADKRSQINRLINVIKSRNNDKVYCDKKYNELRDEVMATREQRDTLAEALEELERTAGQSTLWADPATHNARKALAAMKGGSDE